MKILSQLPTSLALPSLLLIVIAMAAITGVFLAPWQLQVITCLGTLLIVMARILKVYDYKQELVRFGIIVSIGYYMFFMWFFYTLSDNLLGFGMS